MQILLASAKIMNDRTEVAVGEGSVPMFDGDAVRMAAEMGALPVGEIATRLHCNTKIALQNKMRYVSFVADDEKLPAVLAYYGQAYKYLKAATFSDDDFRFAQRHLWMTSFLYGLLRPLDRIHPYRMEGGVKMDCARPATDLFAYWRPRLTDVLIDSVKADDGMLVHLATAEMERLFDWRMVERELTVVHPYFLAEKGQQLKTVTVHAKSCRGAMARHIIRHRLTTPDELRSFALDGYVYREGYGDRLHPHFISTLAD